MNNFEYETLPLEMIFFFFLVSNFKGRGSGIYEEYYSEGLA